MIYLISGKQNIRLRSQMKSIIKKSLQEIDPINFVKHDATQTLVQDIVDDAVCLPLGYDRKAVAVDCCYFLLKGRSKVKVEGEQDFEKLIKYLNNPEPSTDLIFLVNTSENDIDTNNPVYQAIKENGKVITIDEPDPSQWKLVVAHFFKEHWPNVTIDSDAIDEFAKRTEGDYASLGNNGNKLALYTDHITYDAVTLMVIRPLDKTAYLLVNYLIDGHNMDAVILYRDLKKNKAEPVKLINMMADHFRLQSRVSYLVRRGYKDEEIANELNIKPTRAAVLRKKSRLISQKRLQQVLEDLYQLDLQIKSGLVDRFYAFELFLINFKRN